MQPQSTIRGSAAGAPLPSAGSAAARGIIGLPKPRTFARWLALAWSRDSLLRALQDEAIAGLRLSGRVLDLGGDRQSGYHALLAGAAAAIETANLGRDARPDHVCDLEEPLPFPDGAYDHVIAVNTLEHICRDVELIGEAMRVLADGGSFHFFVPFCHKVHGSPRDFHRHTAEWWLRTVTAHPCHSVRIEPLVWDRRSTAVAVMKGGRLLRAFAMALPDVREAARAARRAAREGVTVGEMLRRSAADFALGYYISGIKDRRAGRAAGTSCP